MFSITFWILSYNILQIIIRNLITQRVYQTIQNTAYEIGNIDMLRGLKEEVVSFSFY